MDIYTIVIKPQKRAIARPVEMPLDILPDFHGTVWTNFIRRDDLVKCGILLNKPEVVHKLVKE